MPNNRFSVLFSRVAPDVTVPGRLRLIAPKPVTEGDQPKNAPTKAIIAPKAFVDS